MARSMAGTPTWASGGLPALHIVVQDHHAAVVDNHWLVTELGGSPSRPFAIRRTCRSCTLTPGWPFQGDPRDPLPGSTDSADRLAGRPTSVRDNAFADTPCGGHPPASRLGSIDSRTKSSTRQSASRIRTTTRPAPFHQPCRIPPFSHRERASIGVGVLARSTRTTEAFRDCRTVTVQMFERSGATWSR